MNVQRVFKIIGLVLLLASFTGEVFAGAAGGLPWEAPAETVAKSLLFTAQWIGIIAFFVSMGVLLFAGELPEWGRRLALLVLAMSLIFGVVQFMGIFGAGGQMLPTDIVLEPINVN